MPLFCRLNSVPAFNRSDRMCVRLPIVPAGRYPFLEPLNTLSEEVSMKAVYCPYCGPLLRRSDQAQRQDLIGVPAVEVHGLRRVDDAEV